MDWALTRDGEKPGPRRPSREAQSQPKAPEAPLRTQSLSLGSGVVVMVAAGTAWFRAGFSRVNFGSRGLRLGRRNPGLQLTSQPQALKPGYCGEPRAR